MFRCKSTILFLTLAVFIINLTIFIISIDLSMRLVMNYYYIKLTIIAIVAIIINVTAIAQEKNDKAVGVNFAINSQRKIISIGAKYRYNINKIFRVESSFNYLFDNNILNKWDLFENAHLLIPIGNRLRIYPLAGIGILQKRKNKNPIIEEEWSYYDESKSSIFWALIFGGGIEYRITDKLIINLELIQKSSNDIRYTYLSTGILYRF